MRWVNIVAHCAVMALTVQVSYGDPRALRRRNGSRDAAEERELDACPCLAGDNDGACGICLRLIESHECPPDPDLSLNCGKYGVLGQLCEADHDECGTNNSADNCGGYDVYERIACDAPACSCMNGDNGGACDICLQKVPSSECPSNPGGLNGCTAAEVAIGELCQADDDECGTSNDLNNCGLGYDVYERIACSTPVCSCANGDNGGECGICLRLLESNECDYPVPQRRCTADQVNISQLCEADSYECGTAPDADNCGGWDVYERIPCDDTDPSTKPPTELPSDSPTDPPIDPPGPTYDVEAQWYGLGCYYGCFPVGWTMAESVPLKVGEDVWVSNGQMNIELQSVSGGVADLKVSIQNVISCDHTWDDVTATVDSGDWGPWSDIKICDGSDVRYDTQVQAKVSLA